ncbi:MAG TPA: tetratricopeptide repeat protein [Blastocatellia bacterium]|nr:tetratricopeptide repeat protein [Blastocatellia bacterium]
MTTTKAKAVPSIAPHAEATTSSSKQLWACAALIVVAGVLVYLNSFGGQIVFDDVVITDDQTLRQLWPPWGAMFSPKQIARPLVGLSLAINYAMSGANLWSYHMFNLAIHILAGLVLFGVVRRTLLSDRLKDRFGKASTGLALVVALIWLVHPLNTESVTYLIQRSEAMCGLFYLLTLYCVIRGHSGRNTALWHTAAVLSCAAGMVSKPVMVTAPIMVAIYDWVFFSDPLKQVIKRRASLYAGLAFTWVFLAATVLAASAHQDSESAGFNLAITPLRYLFSQFGVIVYYLRLSVWPYDLCIDYGWPLANSASKIVPYALLIGALVIGTLVALKRRPELGFIGIWFFLILAPTSSVMPIVDLEVEHRTYLSLVAVCALLVLGAYRLAPRLLSWLRLERSSIGRWLTIGAVGIVVAWLGSLTVERNSYYQSRKGMWLDVVQKHPDNPRGHSNLGLSLANEGDLQAAIEQFDEALRLRPNYTDALNNMGMALANSGKKAEAIPYFLRAIELRPNVITAHFNLGQVFASQSRLDEAADQYREELRLNPNSVDARMQLASTLERQKKFTEAAVAYGDTLSVAPNWAQPLCRLALLLVDQEAKELRDPDQAITLAKKAVLVTRRQPVTLDVLASVYSSVGRFDDAVVTAQEAIDMARSNGADQLALAIDGRLRLYKQGRIARP